MLRPATPLAILLLAAFAMLLLSVLSTPIIKAIPLGNYESVSFGVFGYCKGSSCSKIEIGYDTSKLFTSTQSSTFDLPASARNTLSAILIVHPVAAVFTLLMLVLSIVAHLHSPSHSTRYLLLIFILSIVTFIVCLLAFLVDVLLFVPHMAWGSYIVLASTILVAISSLVSCAMRRTVVGRKARQRRIAENAEMSGENYYNRNAQQDAAVAAAASLQPTIPVVSGGNGPSDKLPSFATYEQKKDDGSDERIPLTSRSPSNRSPNDVNANMNASNTGYNAGPPSRSGSRDQYGNPIQAQDAYGVQRGPYGNSMNQRGRGGMAATYRGQRRGGYGAQPYGAPASGRGGYGPPGRGGYGPSGRGGYGQGPNARGGYGGRGGYGAGPMRGGRGPPPSYGRYEGNAAYDRRPPPQHQYGYGPMRSASAGPEEQPSYGNYEPTRSASAGPEAPGSYGMNGANSNGATGGYEAYHPDSISDLPRAESPPPLDSEVPPPIGQAVELDARTGSPAHPPPGFGQFNQQVRDSDSDVAGMLALQQGRPFAQRHETYMSETSHYSQDDQSQYVPPRQGWNQNAGRSSPAMPSPLHIPAQRPPSAGNRGNYYEDVDPRFADPSPQQTLQPEPVEEEPHSAGARSPAPSEQSGFTSVSQRGVNPRYQPSPAPIPPPGYGQPVPRRPVNKNEVNVLNSNPDFMLPGRGGGPSRGGGMVPGSAYPGI